MRIHEAVKKVIESSDKDQKQWAIEARMTEANLSKFLNGRMPIKTTTLESLMACMSESELGQYHLLMIRHGNNCSDVNAAVRVGERLSGTV